MKKKKPSPGRPPFDRKIKVISVGVYEDQMPISAQEVREAIDFHKRSFAETFSPIPGKQDIADV
jgi:hypothetical protein